MGLDYNVADVLQDLAEHLIGNGIVVDPLLRSSKVEANRQGAERLKTRGTISKECPKQDSPGGGRTLVGRH